MAGTWNASTRKEGSLSPEEVRVLSREVVKAIDKLRATWSKKERDLLFHYPLGICTKSDGHYLSGIFTEQFTDELDKRGYDLSTFKFEISPKPGEQRFASQRPEETK